MSLARPSVPVDGISTLRPDLIGLAAYLGATDIAYYFRMRILETAATLGTVETLRKDMLCTGEQLDLAEAALVAGRNLVVASWADVPALAHRGNGHPVASLNGAALPPIAGGAPVAQTPPSKWAGVAEDLKRGLDDYAWAERMEDLPDDY